MSCFVRINKSRSIDLKKPCLQSSERTVMVLICSAGTSLRMPAGWLLKAKQCNGILETTPGLGSNCHGDGAQNADLYPSSTHKRQTYHLILLFILKLISPGQWRFVLKNKFRLFPEEKNVTVACHDCTFVCLFVVRRFNSYIFIYCLFN